MSDAEVGRARLKREPPRLGLVVVGVLLDDDGEGCYRRQMRRFFRWLIVCRSSALAGLLGNILWTFA